MNKRRYVEELEEGERVDDLFLVKSARLAETRAGKPYLLLELSDRTGDIGGPVWDNAEAVATFCQPASPVHLRGLVQSYREKLQLRIEDIRPVPLEQISLPEFVPASTHDLGEMAVQIQKLVASVEDRWVRRLLQRFFSKGEIWQGFQTAPAAKGIHHAYVGGLMEHCLSMARVADMLAGHYPGIDRSLLLAGALLHDIGKTVELSEQVGVVDYTSEGRLKGHLVMGSEMVAAEASRIKDFPEETLTQIQHLILSHHGRLEYGSPILPMTPEAILLNFIDELDSKMNLVEQLRRRQKEEGPRWSDYQRSLERFLYLSPLGRPLGRPLGCEAGPEEPAARESDGRQKTLF